MKLAKAMATVAGMTALSRVAGFARDILTAAILGAGPVADAFFVALKLPNFFRRVTAEGAFSVAFVPLYSETIEKEGHEEARRFAEDVFMFLFIILSALSVVCMYFMPHVIALIAPGFTDDPERYDLAVKLSTITFPYLAFMSLSAMFGGMLNSVGRFAPFAFAPVLFNLCLIIALLLSNYFPNPGYALAIGVFLSGVLQVVFLCFCTMRAKISLNIKRPMFTVKVNKVFALMGPGVIGAGVMHINLFADMIIASFLEEGSISYLYYADRLNQLPLGVVGIAVGTALLPMLSKALARGEDGEARDLFNRALEMCLLLALPAAMALAVIPNELITVLFERGSFTAKDSALTSLVLSFYAIGLPAYIAIKVFSTAHWSRQDTKTPVKISVAATVVNIGMSLLLIRYMGVAGIALATGLTAWMQFIFHVKSLKGMDAVRLDERFKRVMPRIVLSACIMAAVLYSMAQVLESYIYADSGLIKILSLGALVLVALISYGLAVSLSGAVNVKDFKKYMSRRKKV